MKGQRKQLVGRVLSDKMDKTVVVEVERVGRHRRYGKVMRWRKKYKVHDEKNECQVGDLVRIIESRPLSSQKRWRVVEIVKPIGEAVLEVVQ